MGRKKRRGWVQWQIRDVDERSGEKEWKSAVKHDQADSGGVGAVLGDGQAVGQRRGDGRWVGAGHSACALAANQIQVPYSFPTHAPPHLRCRMFWVWRVILVYLTFAFYEQPSPLHIHPCFQS